MQPAFGDEIQRAGGGDIRAEIDLNVMVARDSLILAKSEVVEVVSVERAQGFCYIIAVVIDSAGNGMGRAGCRNGQLDRRDNIALIGENRGPLRDDRPTMSER